MPTRQGGNAAKNSNSFARVMRLRITTARHRRPRRELEKPTSRYRDRSC
jgi:hypothetical protein